MLLISGLIAGLVGLRIRQHLCPQFLRAAAIAFGVRCRPRQMAACVSEGWKGRR